MVHTITGSAQDTERNYKYRHKAYSPLSKGGDLYGRGKGTTYSQCHKPVKARLAPDMPVMVGYNTVDLEKEHITLTLAKGKAVKITKARYLQK